MNRPFSWIRMKRVLIPFLAVAAAASAIGFANTAGADSRTASSRGLGQLTGLLPQNKLTTESAIQVDLSKETVRLPLYPGPRTARPCGTSSWMPRMRGSRRIWV